MKTIKFVIVAAIFSGLMFACNQKPAETKSPEPMAKKVNQKKSTGKDLISQDTFKVWQERWNTNFRAFMAKDSMNYFDMPLDDLRDILNESTATKARFYLGMGMDTIRTKGTETILQLPHLMLVGVNSTGPDFNVIADYTKLCPPFCDKN